MSIFPCLGLGVTLRIVTTNYLGFDVKVCSILFWKYLLFDLSQINFDIKHGMVDIKPLLYRSDSPHTIIKLLVSFLFFFFFLYRYFCSLIYIYLFSIEKQLPYVEKVRYHFVGLLFSLFSCWSASQFLALTFHVCVQSFLQELLRFAMKKEGPLWEDSEVGILSTSHFRLKRLTEKAASYVLVPSFLSLVFDFLLNHNDNEIMKQVSWLLQYCIYCSHQLTACVQLITLFVWTLLVCLFTKFYYCESVWNWWAYEELLHEWI